MTNNLFSLEGKKCVLFGAAGYLGSAAAEAMLDLGAQVVIADMFPEYTKTNTAKFEGNPDVYKRQPSKYMYFTPYVNSERAENPPSRTLQALLSRLYHNLFAK